MFASISKATTRDSQDERVVTFRTSLLVRPARDLDGIALLHDSSSECGGDGIREGQRVGGMKLSDQLLGGKPGPHNHELARVVSIELRDRLRERLAFEHDLPLTPGKRTLYIRRGRHRLWRLVLSNVRFGARGDPHLPVLLANSPCLDRALGH